MLKKILIALAAIIAVFLIVVALQPSEFHVERTATITAPPATVCEVHTTVFPIDGSTAATAWVSLPSRVSSRSDVPFWGASGGAVVSAKGFSLDVCDAGMSDSSVGWAGQDPQAGWGVGRLACYSASG
jgi:hypothetical protein